MAAATMENPLQPETELTRCAIMSDSTVRRPIRWIHARDTHVGAVREINEDSIMVSQALQLWAVADGMGGYEAGNVASSMIVQTLETLENNPALADMVDAVEDALIDVNHRILEYADIMLDGRTLGSTLVSLLIRGRVGICLWAGDSRLCRLRNGQFVQLSRDHSQVEELLQQGVLTEDDVHNHPDSNIITRAIGANKELFIDINVFSVQQGDIFLLCSDGLYNMVTTDEMVETITRLPLEGAVNRLIEQSLENGGDDNISVILVKGESDGKSKSETLNRE